MMNLLYIICFLFTLNRGLCDNSHIHNRLRIVGGENASITDYPYQVSVLFDGFHGCGGSIINENFILTAAHCTYEEVASSISIRVNSSYRNVGDQVYQVCKITIHPNFNDVTFDYDVSILQLVTPLSFGDGVKPITLASSGTQINDGLDAIATGWGRLGEHKSASYQLQVVTLPVISTESCAKYYPSGYVTDRMFCAGYDDGEKDTCQGDSGGPLVVSGIQIGIVSWGIVCAAPNQPGAFAKLPVLIDYINSVINQV